MPMSRWRSAGQDYNINTANRCVEIFKYTYLTEILRNKSYVHEEIKIIVNSDSFVFRLLSSDVKIKICKSIRRKLLSQIYHREMKEALVLLQIYISPSATTAPPVSFWSFPAPKLQLQIKINVYKNTFILFKFII